MTSSLKKLAFIIIAAILGALCGEVAYQYQGSVQSWSYLTDISVHISQLFIGALTWPIVPLVFAAIFVVIYRNSNSQMVGLALKASLFFLCTTFVAVFWGILSAYVFEPGVGIELYSSNTGSASAPKAPSPFLLFSEVELFRAEFWKWWSAKSWSQQITTPPWYWVNLLVLIASAIITAVSFVVLQRIFPSLRTVVRKIEIIAETVLNITVSIMLFVLKFLPLAVFCSVYVVVDKNGLSVFTGPLAVLLFSAVVAMILHALTIITAVKILRGLSGQQVLTYQKSMSQAVLTGWLTRSSMGTLPETLRCAENAGVSPLVRNFIFPFGATVNMDGTTCYLAVVVMAFLQSQGIDLSAALLLAIVLNVVSASVATAAAPSASLVLVAVILSNLLALPEISVGEQAIYAMVAFIIAIDFVGDMFRTATNILGDAQCALFFSSSRRDEAISG